LKFLAVGLHPFAVGMRFAWLKTSKFANPTGQWLSEFNSNCNDEFVWNSFLTTDLRFSSLPVLANCVAGDQHPMILQVEVQLNISESVYSQVNSLKDSINQIEERKIEQEDSTSSSVTINTPEFYKYILSDGHNSIWALILASEVEEGAKILVDPQDLRYFDREKTLVLSKVTVLCKLTEPKRSDKERLEFLLQFLHKENQ
jgi:hypothetical protein